MQTCLICDDHAMLREALAGTVELGWPDATIMQVADYPAAWAAIAAQPDLCISDLVMPGASPVEGIKRLHACAPTTPILIVTGNDDDAVLLELFALGIAGFVPKTSKSAVIEAAIRVVLAGERYTPARLLDLVAGGNGGTSAPARSRLTQRQIDVLTLIAQGQSNKEVARQLALSPATVKAHAAAAMAALGAANRTEAVVMARSAALI